MNLRCLGAAASRYDQQPDDNCIQAFALHRTINLENSSALENYRRNITAPVAMLERPHKEAIVTAQ
jgi:hypothetical protein